MFAHHSLTKQVFPPRLSLRSPGYQFPAGPLALWFACTTVAWLFGWFVQCVVGCGHAAARTVALLQTVAHLSLAQWNRVTMDCGAGALLPGILSRSVAGVVDSVEAVITRVFLHGPEFQMFGVPMGFWNLPHDYAEQPQLLSQICNRITFNTHHGNFWLENKSQCQTMITEKVRGSVAATLGVLLIVAMYSVAVHVGSVVQGVCRLAPWKHAQNLWRRLPSTARTLAVACLCYWAFGGAAMLSELHASIMFLTDLAPQYTFTSNCVGAALLAGAIYVVRYK